MIYVENINSLKKEIIKSGKFIRSSKIKSQISEIYEKDWLSFLRTSLKDADKLEKSYHDLYLLSKKDYFTKSKILEIIKIIQMELDKVRIEQIKNGIKFYEDIKERILKKLQERGLSKIISDLKASEEYIIKEPSVSCSKAREGCEEAFRVIREKKLGIEVKRGTLSQHASELEIKNIISSAEKQFFNSALYGFLSEKGNHSNKEPKTEIDARFGYKLSLITLEYLFDKKLL